MCIVTVSRGSYSGAKAVAEGVASRLETPCVSREIIVEAAEAAGVSARTLSEVLDRPPTFFERVSRERDGYLVFVRAALYANASAGSFVYHGHDGHLLLDLPNVLRVRVVAPLAYRVEAVREAQGLGEKDAHRHIAKIDGQRAKWTRFLYGVAWDDPLLYDLIVNLEKATVDTAAGLITDMARSNRFAWTDALHREAADQALCCGVWAELAKVPETQSAELEVKADDGIVVLQGRTRDDELRRLITEAAERVAGAREIRCEITVPSDLFRT